MQVQFDILRSYTMELRLFKCYLNILGPDSETLNTMFHMTVKSPTVLINLMHQRNEKSLEFCL